MRILLTGANGQVGQQLLPVLKRQGYFVRTITRQKSTNLTSADEQVIEDLSPQSDFLSLLANIDLLIHLADGFNAFEHLPILAHDHVSSSRLETTRALTKAAAETGVDLIYLSTIKTMCGAYTDHVLNEQSPASPQSLYGQLKLKAEQAIMAASLKHKTRAIILRFPVVFGVGKGSMESLCKVLDRPACFPFNGLESKRSLISATSLIEVIITIIKQPTANSGTYLVHDGALSIANIAQIIRQGVNREQHLFALPAPLWRMAEKMPFIGEKVQRFTCSLELDDHYFRKTFNWQPQQDLSKTLLQWAQDSQSK